jgi:hypothetical protein
LVDPNPSNVATWVNFGPSPVLCARPGNAANQRHLLAMSEFRGESDVTDGRMNRHTVPNAIIAISDVSV